MTYTIDPHVLTRTVCGETLLIRLGTGVGYLPDMKVLNDGGAYYWSLLTEGLPEADMLRRAAADTGAREDELRPGLRHFLSLLLEAKYISEKED